MKSKRKKFEYKPRTKEQVQKRATGDGAKFNRYVDDSHGRLWRPKSGKNHIRILPPTWDEPNHFGIDLWLHRDVGPDSATVLCHERMKGKRDPIDEERLEYERAGDDEAAKQLRAYRRVLVWIIDRNDEEQGPQLYDMPVTVDKSLAKISEDEETGEVILIDDPDDGCDVFIDREGEGIQTNYTVRLSRKTGPLHKSDKVRDQWLEHVAEHPLPELLTFLSYSELAQLYGAEPEEDKEEEKTKRTAKAKPKAVEDDEDEDEDEDESPLPDDDDELDDEIGEPEDEDDEDEDEEDVKEKAKKVAAKIRNRK